MFGRNKQKRLESEKRAEQHKKGPQKNNLSKKEKDVNKIEKIF